MHAFYLPKDTSFISKSPFHLLHIPQNREKLLIWLYKQMLKVEISKIRTESRKLSKAAFKVLVTLDFKTCKFPVLPVLIKNAWWADYHRVITLTHFSYFWNRILWLACFHLPLYFFTRDEERNFFSLELLARNSHHLLSEKIWNGALWLLLLMQAHLFQERTIHKWTLKILPCSWKHGPRTCKIRFCSHANILFNLCQWQSILFSETVNFLSRVYNPKSESRMQRASQKNGYSFLNVDILAHIS